MRLSACKLNSSINYYYFFEKEETLILIYKNLISPALISTIYNDFLDLVFSHSFWLVTSQPIELHYSNYCDLWITSNAGSCKPFSFLMFLIIWQYLAVATVLTFKGPQPQTHPIIGNVHLLLLLYFFSNLQQHPFPSTGQEISKQELGIKLFQKCSGTIVNLKILISYFCAYMHGVQSFYRHKYNTTRQLFTSTLIGNE